MWLLLHSIHGCFVACMLQVSHLYHTLFLHRGTLLLKGMCVEH